MTSSPDLTPSESANLIAVRSGRLGPQADHREVVALRARDGPALDLAPVDVDLQRDGLLDEVVAGEDQARLGVVDDAAAMRVRGALAVSRDSVLGTACTATTLGLTFSMSVARPSAPSSADPAAGAEPSSESPPQPATSPSVRHTGSHRRRERAAHIGGAG